jgi:hypothetical protein
VAWCDDSAVNHHSRDRTLSLHEYIASSLIGTPLRKPAEAIRSLIHLPKQWKNPELREIFLEGERSRAAMRRAITPEMNCIDVGCHLGSVLDDIVNLGPRGRHIAIEPLPYKAAWLRRKFPEVEVHQLAIGEGDAVVEFYYQPKNSGFSGLRQHAEGHVTVIRRTKENNWSTQ